MVLASLQSFGRDGFGLPLQCKAYGVGSGIFADMVQASLLACGGNAFCWHLQRIAAQLGTGVRFSAVMVLASLQSFWRNVLCSHPLCSSYGFGSGIFADRVQAYLKAL